MGETREIAWTGRGRWLSFTLSALLMVFAVLELELGAAAGWNIFLGLLLFGVIASSHRKAPPLLLILACLMLLRLVTALAGGVPVLLIPTIVALALASSATLDLRRQARRRLSPRH